jgi:signal transduction histidine kinase
MLCARELHTPGDVRGWMTTNSASNLDERALEDAHLVVSELVTNAIRHSDGQLAWGFRAGPDRKVVWADVAL